MTDPRIAFVVAVARNGVIGEKGTLPWHVSSDMKRFKAITMGKPVIMGRKTWESLPRRPLQGRFNIVVTRRRNYAAEGARVVDSLASALSAAVETGAEEICVIGGGEVFRELMPQASRLYVSEVDLSPEGDVRFPAIDPDEWREVEREAHEKGPRDDAAFIFRVLDRISPIQHN